MMGGSTTSFAASLLLLVLTTLPSDAKESVLITSDQAATAATAADPACVDDEVALLQVKANLHVRFNNNKSDGSQSIPWCWNYLCNFKNCQGYFASDEGKDRDEKIQENVAKAGASHWSLASEESTECQRYTGLPYCCKEEYTNGAFSSAIYYRKNTNNLGANEKQREACESCTSPDAWNHARWKVAAKARDEKEKLARRARRDRVAEEQRRAEEKRARRARKEEEDKRREEQYWKDTLMSQLRKDRKRMPEDMAQRRYAEKARELNRHYGLNVF